MGRREGEGERGKEEAKKEQPSLIRNDRHAN